MRRLKPLSLIPLFFPVLIVISLWSCRPHPPSPSVVTLGDLAKAQRIDSDQFTEQFIGKAYVFECRISDIDEKTRQVSRKIRADCRPLFVATMADGARLPERAGVYRITGVLLGVDTSPGDRGVSWATVTFLFEAAVVTPTN